MLARRWPWLIATALSAFVTGSAFAAEPLRFVPSADDNYAETLTFIGDFNGQSYIQVQLSVTNIGPGKENAVCRFLVVNTGAKPWTANERAGAKAWRYVEGEKRLEVGPCSAAATAQQTVVRAALAAGTVEMTFDGPPRSEVPPNNVIEVDRARHSTILLHLATPVTATVTPPGRTPYTLRGMGYADHSRTEVKPMKIARQWVRFRALNGETPLLLLGREQQTGGFGPLWMWPTRQSPQTLTSFTTKRGGEKQKPTFEVAVTGPQGQAITIRSQTMLFRHAPVEELGILGRAVKPLVGSPVTYTYRGTLQRPGAAPIEGILEVSLDAE